ncbi:MAG: acetolactate decarboxylase [Bacteroidaceae bacterium]|nr:acetolactate decarboxylase [Bacteroidaceae bacterium]
MRIRKVIFVGIISMCLAGMAACKGSDVSMKSDAADRETMYQVATLQSLMVGNYDGFVRIGELRKHGDIGLGTFSRVNGEMIVLDGNVYQALGDGTVRIASDSETTPFSTVTCFEPDIRAKLSPFDNISSLTQQLDSIVAANGRNFIYALRLDVSTRSVTFRTEDAMDKPYAPLAQVLPGKQRSFTRQNMSGTVVAVCFPSFFAGQNTPGWHFHFISSDRKEGGHMLDISTLETCTAKLDATTFFNLYLPDDDTFSRRDLSDDMSDAIDKVER